MGGGTILILILSNFMGIEQHTAQAANLIYFIPTSIAAIWVYWKNKNLDKKIALKMISTGIIFAIFGSYVATLIESKNLKRYFGIFLLAMGMYEIFTTVKNKYKSKFNVASKESGIKSKKNYNLKS